MCCLPGFMTKADLGPEPSGSANGEKKKWFDTELLGNVRSL
jgi:hypothetical protein